MHMNLTAEEMRRADELVAQWTPWLRREAISQALKERGRFVLLTASAITEQPAPNFVTMAEEMAHRRGYLHGFDAGMDAVRAAPWDTVCEFFDGPLGAWGHGRAVFMEQPPRMGQAGDAP